MRSYEETNLSWQYFSNKKVFLVYFTYVALTSTTLSNKKLHIFFFFFFQGFLLQTLTTDRTGEEHSDIYLLLCLWDEYHIFLITPLVFNRLLLNEIYHLIELLLDWLMWCLIFVCLLVDLILSFVRTIWHEKPVSSNSHRLYPCTASKPTNQEC